MKIYNLIFLLLLQFPLVFSEPSDMAALVPGTTGEVKTGNVKLGIVLKSTDGGQTWEDISEGLPEHLAGNGFQRDAFFTNDNGLYLRSGDGLYHSKPGSTAPFWNKEILQKGCARVTPGRNGIFAYNHNGKFIQNVNGTNEWIPIYISLNANEVQSVFESANGIILVGSIKGLFKSSDAGKTWKQVDAGGWGMKVVESNGVLMATSQKGILRSTDDGESWEVVISEGGVGIAVEPIKGGFAAITYNTTSKTRRVRTSYDGGNTWEAIDAGLPPNLSMTSIVEVGQYFFCGHPAGILRSSDKGKTWKLLLRSDDKKVFNLSVSDDVIYAIPGSEGC